MPTPSIAAANKVVTSEDMPTPSIAAANKVVTCEILDSIFNDSSSLKENRVYQSWNMSNELTLLS